MTARTYVFAPTGEIQQSGQILGDPKALYKVYGTEAEILAVFPPGAAIGCSSDTKTEWSYTVGQGWSPAGPFARDASGNLVASGLVIAPRFSAPRSRRFVAGVGSALAGPVSVCEQFPAVAAFVGGRLTFWNRDTAATLEIASCWVAPCPTAANTGNTLTWTDVTVNGVGAISVPVAKKRGTSSTDVVPGTIRSDYFGLLSTPRTDTGVGTDPLLYIRMVLSNGGVVELVTANGQSLYKADSGFEWGSNNYSGTITKTTSFSHVATGGLSGSGIVSVEFDYGAAPVVDVLAIGSSSMAGNQTTSNKYAPVDGAAKYAKANSKPILISQFKTAIGSSTSSFALESFKAILATDLVPQIVVIPSWFPNDGSDGPAFRRSLAVTRECINIARSKGIAVVLLTPNPSSTVTTGSIYTSWSDRRAWALAQAGNGVTVVDIAAILADLSLGNYAAGMSTDGIHPNSAGIDAISGIMYDGIAAAYASLKVVGG